MSAPSSPFHALTLKFNGRATRLISNVGVSLPFDPDTVDPDHTFDQVQTRALWDTGASRSVVTPVVATQVGLVPVGKTKISHAVGESEVNQYLANFYLPNGVGITGLLVSECADTEGFGVIIGMDVMTHGDFTITNLNGETWMSFRTPSMSRVDYVGEANRLQFSGVPRNAPCPCGRKHSNGKSVKFKNCHGAS